MVIGSSPIRRTKTKMEDINLIEKIVLIASVIIVGAINLQLLIEKIKDGKNRRSIKRKNQ